MIRDYRRVFCGLGVAVIFAVLAFGPSAIKASPFTDHFDDLIADLQARAGTLSNSVDKTGQTQYKAILKVLATLEVKPSTSLATDIKNLGTAAKGLTKAFPADFVPPTSSIVTNLETALEGLSGEVQDSLDTTETAINALAAGSCKDKANATLVAAQALLDSALAAPDFASASKLLGSASKAAAKAAAAAAKCVPSGGGGGGGGGMNATVTGTINSGFHSDFPSATYTTSLDMFSIVGGDANGIGINLIVTNVTAATAYPLSSSTTLSQTSPFLVFQGAVGTVTFTSLNPLAGNFSFTAPQVIGGSGSVTVNSGSFTVSTVITVP